MIRAKHAIGSRLSARRHAGWKRSSRRLAAVALCSLSGVVAGAQESTPATIGGLQTVTPALPTQNRRPLEGGEPDQQWRINRPEADNAPTASFIDSLKGNDAAISVLIEQGKLITTKSPIAREDGTALIAVGDPSILEFEFLPNPRMIRVVGLRAGVTDLSITTDDGQVYNLEVHVGWDLELLNAHLRQVFPDAQLRLAQIREHIVVEGEARSPAQVTQIYDTISAFLESVQPRRQVQQQSQQLQNAAGQPLPPAARPLEGEEYVDDQIAAEEQTFRANSQVQFASAQIINLIRVPGIQQVMLQVRVAELNRTAAREIGADLLYVDTDNGTTLGTLIGGDATAFGIFPTASFDIRLQALRRNSVLTLLAEPNLMAMSGHEASFLAGGEFPVPVPQGGGLTNNVTVEFQDFGVLLNFVPYVQDDETIRLHVAPEVSTIDFALGTTLVVGGDPVPGLNVRRASTTVELRQGQTLAIAGLLQVDMAADTQRIPGLGDLPYLGPFFSNTTHRRAEKELLVLVTPYLVAPMECDQVMPLPGTEVLDPNDKEFYFLNRIEGRTGRPFRSTTAWDDPLGLVELMKLEQKSTCGPVGFSQ